MFNSELRDFIGKYVAISVKAKRIMRRKEDVIKTIKLIIDQGPKFDWLSSRTEEAIKTCLRQGLGVLEAWQRTEENLYKRQKAIEVETLQDHEINKIKTQMTVLRKDRRRIIKKVNRQYKNFMRDVFGITVEPSKEPNQQESQVSNGFQSNTTMTLLSENELHGGHRQRE